MEHAYKGFPVEWLARFLCHQPDCGGALHAVEAGDQPFLLHAQVACARCGTRYPVRHGILRLLDPAVLDAESSHEREVRDEQAQALDHGWETTDWVRMELVPTMRASEPLREASVLELGAGTGRYSVRMAERGARVIAVDFSFEALRTLSLRLQPGWQVGLVEADCTRLRVQPASHDLVASTLLSNLPTAEHRAALYRLAATALRDGGKFVFSAHHWSWRARRRGEAKSGPYRPGGIYRYLFREAELRQEVKRFFSAVACRPVQIHLPLSGRLRVQVLASRLCERVWPLNRLGELLLVVARKPAEPLAALALSLLQLACWLAPELAVLA
jgi:SAM-dependent methyltransferase